MHVYGQQDKCEQAIPVLDTLGKKLKRSIGHRMEIVWTFTGNRMNFGYP